MSIHLFVMNKVLYINSKYAWYPAELFYEMSGLRYHFSQFLSFAASGGLFILMLPDIEGDLSSDDRL